MNLPTKLSVIRIITAILIVILLIFPFYNINIILPTYIVWGVKIDLIYIIAGVLFIFGSFTDFLDGYIARRDNLITNTGKMLDAIADKVLVDSVLILLTANNDIAPIIPIVIIIRDILVNAIKLEVAGKGLVVAAIKSGKLKTAALMIGISLKFFYNLPFELININVADALLYLAAILSITSMIEYYNLNKKLLFSKVEL